MGQAGELGAGMGVRRGRGDTGLAGPRILAASMHKLGAPCPLSDAAPPPTPPRSRPLPAELQRPADPQARAPRAAGRCPAAASAHTWARHPGHQGWDARVPPRAAERDLSRCEGPLAGMGVPWLAWAGLSAVFPQGGPRQVWGRSDVLPL